MTKIHDRRSNDILKAGNYRPIMVDDPYERGEKITVLRQLRGDPLGRLHDRAQIDDAQFRAGREYQKIWELTECGARAIDPTKERVDGGAAPDPMRSSRTQAFERLKEVNELLKPKAAALAYDMLARNMPIEAVLYERGLAGQWTTRVYGKMFRECLDQMAKHFGFSNGENCERRSIRSHSR